MTNTIHIEESMAVGDSFIWVLKNLNNRELARSSWNFMSNDAAHQSAETMIDLASGTQLLPRVHERDSRWTWHLEHLVSQKSFPFKHFRSIAKGIGSCSTKAEALSTACQASAWFKNARVVKS